MSRSRRRTQCPAYLCWKGHRRKPERWTQFAHHRQPSRADFAEKRVEGDSRHRTSYEAVCYYRPAEGSVELCLQRDHVKADELDRLPDSRPRSREIRSIGSGHRLSCSSRLFEHLCDIPYTGKLEDLVRIREKGSRCPWL